jgi:hypothetical protein
MKVKAVIIICQTSNQIATTEESYCSSKFIFSDFLGKYICIPLQIIETLISFIRDFVYCLLYRKQTTMATFRIFIHPHWYFILDTGLIYITIYKIKVSINCNGIQMYFPRKSLSKYLITDTIDFNKYVHDIDIFINDKWRKYAGGDIGRLFKITR